MTTYVSSVSSFFFSSRRRHTRFDCDWSSDVCSSDLDDVRSRRVTPFPGPERSAAPSRSGLAARKPETWRLGLVHPVEDHQVAADLSRSEERRVGKEGRSRWAPYH